MPYPHAILLSLFAGAGSSAGTKPKLKRAKVINTIMNEGAFRDKTAIKERKDYAECLKQKEKENRLRKKTLSMRDLHISEYQQVRREKVYYQPKTTKAKNF